MDRYVLCLYDDYNTVEKYVTDCLDKHKKKEEYENCQIFKIPSKLYVCYKMSTAKLKLESNGVMRFDKGNPWVYYLIDVNRFFNDMTYNADICNNLNLIYMDAMLCNKEYYIYTDVGKERFEIMSKHIDGVFLKEICKNRMMFIEEMG